MRSASHPPSSSNRKETSVEKLSKLKQSLNYSIKKSRDSLYDSKGGSEAHESAVSIRSSVAGEENLRESSIRSQNSLLRRLTTKLKSIRDKSIESNLSGATTPLLQSIEKVDDKTI